MTPQTAPEKSLLDRMALVCAESPGTDTPGFACKLLRDGRPRQPSIGLSLVMRRSGAALPVAPGTGEHFLLARETSSGERSAASRMLSAGAIAAFTLEADEGNLSAGLLAFASRVPGDAAIICATGHRPPGIEAGVTLSIRDASDGPPARSHAGFAAEADAVVSFDGADWDFPDDGLAYHGGRWLIRQSASAVILSGGKSTRIGIDKSLLDFRGRPMIAHIADQLSPMFEKVVVSTNEPSKHGFLGLQMIGDRQEGKGPLMGIASAVQGTGAELCFVIGCDIPWVEYRFVNKMLKHAEGYDIVMPRHPDGRFEPLFAVYRRTVCEPAFDLLERGARRIVELFDSRRVAFLDFDGGSWYRNINTMDDYIDLSGTGTGT